MQALRIYTNQEFAMVEPTGREFKNNLLLWHCADMGVVMKFISRDYDYCTSLHNLSLQFLNYASRDTLLYLLSELFQALRTYTDDKVEDFLVDVSTKWPSLTHGIIWMTEVETQPSEDVKGRKVPLDREDNLPDTCKRMIDRIMRKLRKYQNDFFRTESDFFEEITGISGILKPEMSKDEKRAIIKSNLIQINKNIPENVYLPTNPSCIVVSIVETSGAPMQSAAKCPIRVTFNVIEMKSDSEILEEEEKVPDDHSQAISEDKLIKLPSNIGKPGRKSNDSNMSSMRQNMDDYEKQIFKSHKHLMKTSMSFAHSGRFSGLLGKRHELPSNLMQQYKEEKRGGTFFQRGKPRLTAVGSDTVPSKNKPDISQSDNFKGEVKKVSCIFKVFDDVRQDILALKIIKLFKDIFDLFQLDLHIFPYNVLCNRTGKDRDIGGIIECVPNASSRDELGKDFDVDMYQYFIEKFGGEDTNGFKKAQQNFVRSLAAYSVFSYIVQTKDRHNGNIMIDNFGNLVHIDFGYIFDWSPGGDMRFESADFKFTKEMIKILGDSKNSDSYKLFVKKAVQGYLAVRKFAHQICDLVYFLYHSGLPCFKVKSMKLLTKRFRLDLNECQAADHYRKVINNAHNKWTTKVYDQVQYVQNKIAY
jgi:hypothetical protein